MFAYLRYPSPMPLLLTLLIGCGCPDLSEIEVRDPEALITDREVSIIETAIASFGQWTGREGVCVGWVEVEEDITYVGEPVAGTYNYDHIAVDAADGGLASTTAHELCHALDHEEGHVAARPDLFTADLVPKSKLYPTVEARADESFAQACERGPSDVTVGTWRDEQCGTTTVDPIEKYLADHVFTQAYGPFSWNDSVDGSPWDARAHDFATWRVPEVTQAELTRLVVVLPTASFVADLAVTESALWLLLLLEVDGNEGVAWMSVDPDTGVTSAVQVLDTTEGFFVGAAFSRGTSLPVVAITELPDVTVPAFESQMYQIDPQSGAASPLLVPQDDRWVGAMAVSDHTLYWYQAECPMCLDMPLWRRDLNDPDATPEIVLDAPDSDLLIPVAGGLVIPTPTGFWLSDETGAAWEEHVLPSGLVVVGTIGPTELLLQLQDQPVFLTLDLESGDLVTLGDPCEALPAQAPWRGRSGEIIGVGEVLPGSIELVRVVREG